ncbi:MAG: DUF5678 domain-containing protein [Elusimicrobiota bacterium]|nr:DUF5678 domain-containing protein [Elusimicrobiota bacterium]
MGQNIWGVLDAYAGLWVAMDNQGRVIHSAGTLDEAMKGAGPRAGSLTFVWAAGEPK